MIKLLIFLAFIYILASVLKIFISDYDKCYSEMENAGIAAFNCCCGLTGGTRHTDIGSTAMEYLTDKDGEKIRDYIGVIEDRINDLEGELSEFKKYFEPYDIDEENAEAIIRSKCPNIDSAKDYIQSRLAEDDPMNFSVGKIVHDLMAKELAEDLRKQILEEDSKC